MSIAQPEREAALLAGLSLVSVNKVAMSVERHSVDDVTGVQFVVEAKYGATERQVFFQFDSHLALGGTAGAVADLRTSIVALFAVSETAGSDWQELLPGVAGLAAMAAHPYAREAFGTLAVGVGLPPITLGLLRAGLPNPDSVTVGSSTFNLSATQGVDEPVPESGG